MEGHTLFKGELISRKKKKSVKLSPPPLIFERFSAANVYYQTLPQHLRTQNI